MRDKLNEPIRLEGRGVILEEIVPKFFPYVIKWRNDQTLNKYLNQPEELTTAKQSVWYEQRYLKDDTQGFLVMVDKNTSTPFGTIGWTDMDLANRRCILGRLLLGDKKFSNSGPFMESFFLLGDYLYKKVDIMYVHVGLQNKRALRLNKVLGFVPNQGHIQYPHELFVNGDINRPQKELLRNKKQYEEVKKSMYTDIIDILFDN